MRRHGIRNSMIYFSKVSILMSLTLGGAYALWHFVGPLPGEWFGKPTDAGTFGDSYGYVNSLLSSLTMAGAIVAIVLQTVELRNQRLEMDESQETWTEQRDAMDRQASATLANALVLSSAGLSSSFRSELTAEVALLLDNQLRIKPQDDRKLLPVILECQRILTAHESTWDVLCEELEYQLKTLMKETNSFSIKVHVAHFVDYLMESAVDKSPESRLQHVEEFRHRLDVARHMFVRKR